MTDYKPDPTMRSELFTALQRRAQGLARLNYQHIAANGLWVEGDTRSDELRVADEGEFAAICRVLDRYISYEPNTTDSMRWFIDQARSYTKGST